MLRYKLTEICEDILFKNEAKNAGIAGLRRVFLTKLLDKRASRCGLFISLQPLNVIKTSKGRGGHEKWSRVDLDRPITIQTHIDPVPEFIVKQVLRYLEISREDFFKNMK